MSEVSSILPLAMRSPDDRWLIRPVVMADVTALRATLWAHRSETRSREIIRRVAHAQSRKQGVGVVVCAPDRPQLLAYGQYLNWANCAEISDLIVLENMRSQGIGTAMIQHLVRVAAENKVRCIEIGVATSNPRARALYNKLGFEEKYTRMLDVGNGVEPVIYLSLAIDASLK